VRMILFFCALATSANVSASTGTFVPSGSIGHLQTRTGMSLMPEPVQGRAGDGPRPEWEGRVPRWVTLGVAVSLTVIFVLANGTYSDSSLPEPSSAP
jgi:hypothetical protein